MATNDNDDSDSGIETRINELTQRLQQRAGGQMVSWELATLPDEDREAFWRRAIAVDNALEDGPFTTDFERLQKAGIELPDAESMDDAALGQKLWEVIHALATLRVFLSATDHLSDRELYSRLWRESLREEIPVSDGDDGRTSHMDLVSTGTAEDIQHYLRFYADEETRRRWVEQFQDDVLPPHDKLPYDRDRHLPQAHADPESVD